MRNCDTSYVQVRLLKELVASNRKGGIDSVFPYILYGMSKYFDGFNILYQPWKLVCC